jgi:hypothetical protein
MPVCSVNHLTNAHADGDSEQVDDVRCRDVDTCTRRRSTSTHAYTLQTGMNFTAPKIYEN